MVHRSRATLMMQVAPVALAAALVFALAPSCTMPECAGTMGLAEMMDHSCDDFMMVDDTPDGVPAPQPPLLAVFTLDSVDISRSVLAYSYMPSAEIPLAHDDPLGARLRI